jgi:hypothetical protein
LGYVAVLVSELKEKSAMHESMRRPVMRDMSTKVKCRMD